MAELFIIAMWIGTVLFVFWLFRGFFLWYFKIPETIKLLEQILAELQKSNQVNQK